MKDITPYEAAGVIVLVCSQQMTTMKCGAALGQNDKIEWQARCVIKTLEGTVGVADNFDEGQNLGDI